MNGHLRRARYASGSIGAACESVAGALATRSMTVNAADIGDVEGE